MPFALVASALAVLLSAAPAAAAADGRAVFLENCASCHGEKGNADTELGAKYMAEDFTTPEFRKEFGGKPDKVKKVLRSGVKNTKMKSFKDVLSADELDAVAAYVLTLAAGGAAK